MSFCILTLGTQGWLSWWLFNEYQPVWRTNYLAGAPFTYHQPEWVKVYPSFPQQSIVMVSAGLALWTYASISTLTEGIIYYIYLFGARSGLNHQAHCPYSIAGLLLINIVILTTLPVRLIPIFFVITASKSSLSSLQHGYTILLLGCVLFFYQWCFMFDLHSRCSVVKVSSTLYWLAALFYTSASKRTCSSNGRNKWRTVFHCPHPSFVGHRVLSRPP